MSEPTFDWETCKHTEISALMAVSICERVVEDEDIVEQLKDEIHDHASGMMYARGKRRAPGSYQ